MLIAVILEIIDADIFKVERFHLELQWPLFKMAGQLLLLPMVLSMLQDDLVGLWYVFLAVNSFVTTFQAGFGPTFGRNVAFCWSGSTAFLVEGAPKVDGGEVNFPVLRALIGSCETHISDDCFCCVDRSCLSRKPICRICFRGVDACSIHCCLGSFLHWRFC